MLPVSASESATMDSAYIAIDANDDGTLPPEADLDCSDGAGQQLCAGESIGVFIGLGATRTIEAAGTQ